METILDSASMRICDDCTMKRLAVSEDFLIKRAAAGLVDYMQNSGYNTQKVLFACGAGNNGADGIYAAGLFAASGGFAAIYLAKPRTELTPMCRELLCHAEKSGAVVVGELYFSTYTLIVDALVGIGLSGNTGGALADIIDEINRCHDNGCTVIAADIPSGISADTGAVMGHAIRADATVTFSIRKIGQLLYPGCEYCGSLHVCDIGITNDRFTGLQVMEQRDLAMLPKRYAYANKGTYGRVAVVGGRKNMCGAAYLCALAAYRSGAGLVEIVTCEENRVILQTLLPEAVLTTYDEALPDESIIAEALSRATSAAVGCGMGQDSSALSILKAVFKSLKSPAVIDADALNLIAKNNLSYPDAQIIITPHVAEMARLCKKSVSDITSDLIGAAKTYSSVSGVVCVLKDAHSVISDGECVRLIESRAAALAKGGSGDVLCGVIASLLAQGGDTLTAASLGAFVHSRAGEKGGERFGERSLLAHEITECLADAFM